MASRLLSEDQLLCPICLGVFVQPVSTPCGHNYCMACLTSHWDSSSACFCPVCKATFIHRPDLRVNTFISGLAEQFRTLQLCEDEEERASSKVLCDICTVTQKEAVKSCVECLTSYCESHLEPHWRVSGLRRHTLIEPLPSFDDRVCKKHSQLLVLFCKNEGVLLCHVCSSSQHSNHETVPLQQAFEDLRAQLGFTEARAQTTIREGLQKVSTFRESIKQRQDQTKRVIADSVQALNLVVSQVQKSHEDLVKKLEDKQQEADSEAEEVLHQIECKVAALKETEDKLKELKNTEDPLLFLQKYSGLSSLPQSGDFSTQHLDSDTDLQEMKQSLSRCASQLQSFMEKINKEICTLSASSDLRRVQQCAVDFVLDPETAHHCLILSCDLKEVWFNTRGKIPRDTNPKRFIYHLAVLGAKAFSSGQFYFEVYVGAKTEWLLGVARASVQRKVEIVSRPGCGVWALYFRLSEFERYCCPKVPVHQGKVESVGVFVDYEGGRVSFYDVRAATLIFSFTDCVFTEKLYPIFSPCDNEFPSNLGPMKIVPVSH